MDGSNIRTSVVIELSNELESGGQKMHQVDLNDANASKNYVIDQIFCGENVTVYALFELEEDEGTKDSEENFLEETTNSDASEDGKFREEKESTRKTRDARAGEEEPQKNISKKGSFYCLQQYLEDSDTLRAEHSGMKVLYTKEAVLKCQQQRGEKKCGTNGMMKRSRGVNTDVSLCPKLLDEVQKIIGSNISRLKREDKRFIDVPTRSPTNSPKLSSTFIQTCGSSSTSSINEARKSSPNFLLVPVVVTDNGLKSRFEEKTETPERAIWNGKESEISTFGNSFTDMFADKTKFNERNYEMKDNEQQTDMKCSCGGQFFNVHQKPEKIKSRKTESENDGVSKQSILEEIKSVQLKLNLIIQSLENNNSRLTKTELNRSREAVRECVKKISVDIVSGKLGEESNSALSTKELSATVGVEDLTNDAGRIGKNSSQTETVLVEKKKEIMSSQISTTSLASIASTGSTYNTFSLKTLLDINKINSKEMGTYLNGHGKRITVRGKSCRANQASKSDSNIRYSAFADFKQQHGQGQHARKSQSFESQHEKSDLFGNKKLKNNTSLKPENNGKGMTKAFPVPVNSLPDGLTPKKCEMGDEAAKKKSSKPNLLNLTTGIIDGEELFNSLKKDILKVPLARDEDGIKGQKSPKNRLTLPQVLYKNDKLVVQYCDSTQANSNLVIKPGQISVSNQEKLRAKTPRNTADARRKGNIAEKDRAAWQRTSNVGESSSRKDMPCSSRTFMKASPSKPLRTERKEFLFEPTKQKLLNRAVKSVDRANPDSKLHIDKLVKSAMENNASGKPVNSKHNQGDRNLEKNDALSSRPPSQKRRRDLTTKGTTEADEKSYISFTKKNSRTSIVENKKCSLERLMEKEKADQVLVFDKKMENFYVAKKVAGSNAAETETIEREASPVVVELFSKKPASLDVEPDNEVILEVAEEQDSAWTIEQRDATKSSSPKESLEMNSFNIFSDEDAEKAIVKSVWALTKVLLYGDGTKKLEILEASLNPPEYTLNSESMNSNKIR